MRHWRIGLAALAVATPASAQVTLTPGHSVMVTIGANGEAKASPVRAAELTPYDQQNLTQLRSVYETMPSRPGEVLPAVALKPGDHPQPVVAPDTMEILFYANDDESLLVLQNGYGRGVTYRAVITTRGQTGPTDVCLLIPGKRTSEHWPYAIEKIELSEFTFEDYAFDRPLPCR